MFSKAFLIDRSREYIDVCYVILEGHGGLKVSNE